MLAQKHLLNHSLVSCCKVNTSSYSYFQSFVTCMQRLSLNISVCVVKEITRSCNTVDTGLLAVN